jgi:hypothetical protein
LSSKGKSWKPSENDYEHFGILIFTRFIVWDDDDDDDVGKVYVNCLFVHKKCMAKYRGSQEG